MAMQDRAKGQPVGPVRKGSSEQNLIGSRLTSVANQELPFLPAPTAQVLVLAVAARMRGLILNRSLSSWEHLVWMRLTCMANQLVTGISDRSTYPASDTACMTGPKALQESLKGT